MSIKNIILSSVLVIALIGVVSWLTASWHYNNMERELRLKANAQISKVEARHDAMWKILNQKAQVSEKYKESFDTIYTHIIEGRYATDDGSLMKWIHEANPQFDSSLYKDLSDAIETERVAFFNEQTAMLDIKRQHDALCTTVPGKWFIDDKSEIEYKVISSTKSKQVMETGIDNDTQVF